jgi:hypothetical protein
VKVTMLLSWLQIRNNIVTMTFAWKDWGPQSLLSNRYKGI